MTCPVCDGQGLLGFDLCPRCLGDEEICVYVSDVGPEGKEETKSLDIFNSKRRERS